MSKDANNKPPKIKQIPLSELPADGNWYQHQDGSVIYKKQNYGGEPTIDRVYDSNSTQETVPNVIIVEEE